MDNQDKNLAAMEQGYMAAQAESAFGSIIADQIHNTMVRLIALYRSGVYTHDQLLGHIAEISGLETLRSTLETKQRMAINARKKELNDAP